MTIHERAEYFWRRAGCPENHALKYWVMAERFEFTCSFVRHLMAGERQGIKLSNYGKTEEEVTEALLMAAAGATLSECQPEAWRSP